MYNWQEMWKSYYKILFTMAIVLYGNNFQKIENLAKILKLHVISLITLHMYQRLYIYPGIEKYFFKNTGTTDFHMFINVHVFASVLCHNSTPF